MGASETQAETTEETPKSLTPEDVEKKITDHKRRLEKGFNEKLEASKAELREEFEAKFKAPKAEKKDAKEPDETAKRIEALEAKTKKAEDALASERAATARKSEESELVKAIRAGGVSDEDYAEAVTALLRGKVSTSKAGQIVFAGEDEELTVADGVAKFLAAKGKKFVSPQGASGSGSNFREGSAKPVTSVGDAREYLRKHLLGGAG